MSQSLLHQVTYSDNAIEEGYKITLMSQSLLHQVTYSDTLLSERGASAPFLSQSLLHQVTYSDWVSGTLRAPKKHVSIPFTSGHVFRPPALLGGLRRRLDVSIPFTSGHVFRLSDYLSDENTIVIGLNPFYIRSRIPTWHNKELRCRDKWCLNPFYIRSRIPTKSWRSASGTRKVVSIPFTSGHVFRRWLARSVRLADSCLNPFYIRSRIPTAEDPASSVETIIVSQSLLHQVTYSDCSK